MGVRAVFLVFVLVVSIGGEGLSVESAADDDVRLDRFQLRLRQLGDEIATAQTELHAVGRQMTENRLESDLKQVITITIRDLNRLATQVIPNVEDALSISSGGVSRERLEKLKALEMAFSVALGRLQERLGPLDVRKQLSEAIQKQAAASERLAELRAQWEEKEGHSTEKLGAEDVRALVGVAQEQLEALQSIRALIQKGRQARSSGSVGHNSLENAFNWLEKSDAAGLSEEAAGLIEQNRLRRAGQIQGQVLAMLQELHGKMIGGSGRWNELVRRKELLESARKIQERAIHQVRNLNPENDQMLARVIQDQNAVHAILSQWAAADSSLKKWADRAARARRELVLEDVTAALATQQEVLGYLTQSQIGPADAGVEAVSLVKRKFDLNILADQLSSIDYDLIAMIQRTRAIDVANSFSLARPQWTQALEVRQLIEGIKALGLGLGVKQGEGTAGGGSGSKDESSAQALGAGLDLLDKVGTELESAARALANKDTEMAKGSQNEALRSLTMARDKLAKWSGLVLNPVSSAGSMPDPEDSDGSPGKEEERPGKGRSALLEAEKTERVRNANWDVALPPWTRSQVQRSLEMPMPSPYERLIRLYFRNLSDLKKEK